MTPKTTIMRFEVLLFATVAACSNDWLFSSAFLGPNRNIKNGWSNRISYADSSLFAKNILLAFDGTGNNARDFYPDKDNDRHFTNVLKLHLLAGGDLNNKSDGTVPGQISIYERGIGAKSDFDTIQMIRQLGGDLSRQTEPMRKRLEKVYEEGDKLFLLGFSRGAASARKFAMELHENGVTTKDGKEISQPPIEFLGCFETVSMQVKKNFFRIIFRSRKEELTRCSVVGEKNGVIAPNVNKAVHHVALDDNRQFTPLPCFPPVLMGNEDRVEEVWFPGEHGDVGGNFYTKGIPDCSCQVMKEWMEKYGLKFLEPHQIEDESLKLDREPGLEFNKTDIDITPDPTDKIHLKADCQVRTDDYTPSYRPVYVSKSDSKDPNGVVKINKCVLEHMESEKAKGSKYPMNSELKKNKFVVTGPLSVVLEDETKRLQELIQSDY